MKCPNCGRANGKTNKYCRECGTRLDVLIAVQELAEPRLDEVGLGAELFGVIELFESGDIDAALQNGEKLVEANPGSASAHSIVALVYERKAEEELDEGDPERSRAFLKLAIGHYEEIIDLNPDSSADREKLAVLRLKYSGHEAAARPDRSRIVEAMRTVPVPVWAGFGAFLVVLALVVIFTSPSETKPQQTAKMQPAGRSTVDVTPTPAPEPSLSVYTFPQAANAPSAPSPAMPVPRVSTPVAPEVKPLHLPEIDQELTLVPEPRVTTRKPSDSVKPADNVQDKQPASSTTGGTLLAQAIRLHDQGKLSEAVGAANQAIVLYNADVDAGKSVEAARRGIANANKLISVWQESASNTP